jgi:hypothetical protein
MKNSNSNIATFLFALLLVGNQAFSQNTFIFKVLGVSGAVKKQTGSGSMALTTGTKLSGEETILVESGYCGLMHSSGKGLEVKKPGTYLVSDLAKGINANAKPAKVSDKYVNYVMGQLTKEEAEDINSNHRKYMEVTGSVERASTNYRIKMVALASNEVLGKSYTLHWNSNAKDVEYVLEVHNLFNEVIFSAKTKETSAAVDFGPLFSRHGKNLIVSVKVTGRPEIKSKEYSFKQIAENTASELGLSQEKNSAAYMVNGMICEENNLYMDALAYYKEASNSESNVEGYQAAYQNLLNRMGGK